MYNYVTNLDLLLCPYIIKSIKSGQGQVGATFMITTHESNNERCTSSIELVRAKISEKAKKDF